MTPGEDRVPAREAVRTWLGAMSRRRSVRTTATFTVDGALRRTAQATVVDGGHSFRIDRRSMMGDPRTVTMVAVDDRAWVSQHHEPDARDDELDWVPVPEGAEAEEPRYRHIFAVAADFPGFSDPWRILPELEELTTFTVTASTAGGRTWDLVPLRALPWFWPFGSKPNPLFSVRMECDEHDLPRRLEMTLSDGQDASKYQAWVVVLEDWDADALISPPPAMRIVPP